MGATSASWTYGDRRVLADDSHPGPKRGPSTTATWRRPRSAVVSATPSTITTVPSGTPDRTAPTTASSRARPAARPPPSGRAPASTSVAGHRATTSATAAGVAGSPGT